MTEREWMQDGFRYALALTHDEHDAKDLVQAAFLKLYRKKGGVESQALLITTIRNQHIDQRRRAKLIVFTQEPEAGREEPGTAAASPGAAMDVAELLSRLRPEEREALYLNLVEGYSAREIAELTDQPRNTVLSLMHRGKEKLKAVIFGGESHAAGSGNDV